MNQMAEHRIPLGGQLPTEGDLMKRFSVSRTTVRQALSELSFEGLVDRQPGRGTFRTLPAERARHKDRTMLVGIWFCLPPGSLYGPIADGIREELGQWDYHAVLEGGLENGDERRGVQALIRTSTPG